MPVYNCEKYLEKAIASVLCQEGAEIEIIAVEDCSTDGSRALLQTIEQKDARVKAVYNETNQGVARVRNTALEKATGDFLAFCDSDDVVPTGAYRALLQKTDGNDIVIGTFDNYYDETGIAEHCRHEKKSEKSTFFALFEVCCLWTKLIRRSFVEENGFRFDPEARIGEDVIFLSQLATRSPRCVLIPENVYMHIHYAEEGYRSLTHIYTLDAYRQHIRCRERMLEVCKEIPEARDYVYLRFSDHLEKLLCAIPEGEERSEAFRLFRDFMTRYPYEEHRQFFFAMTGVPFEGFADTDADAYFERKRTVPARERVAAEFDCGYIGMRWILRYFKGWLRFKIFGRKRGN